MQYDSEPRAIVTTRRSRASSWKVGVLAFLVLLAALGTWAFVTFLYPWGLQATLKGHADGIRRVAFSPDGKTLATASLDRTARLWDLATGKERAVLQGHTDDVWSVAFSPDSKLLATASLDGTVKVWDTATGQVSIASLGHEPAAAGSPVRAYTVAFSPDGHTLASGGSDRSVRLWNVATGRPCGFFANHTDHVLSLAIASDGKLLASRTKDGTITLWDIVTGKRLRTIEGDNFRSDIWSLALAPDGKTLGTNSDPLPSEGRGVKLWDIKTGQERFTLKTNRMVSGVAFSPDGKIVAGAGSDGTLRFWDARTGQLLGTKYLVEACEVAFSPDGKTLATCGRRNTVQLWDMSKVLAATE